MRRRKRKDEILYSKIIKGDTLNYRWEVQFDWTDGYVGITQLENDRVLERVLLSPKQVKALLAFIDECKK